jgi:hypothetical protein
MPLDLDNIDITEQQIQEMKEKYPEFKIIDEEDKGSDLLHTAKVFLYSKKYSSFNAKFFVYLLPSASAGANIYRGDEFQYSISTCSGQWSKKIKDLSRIVGEIDEKTLGAVKHKLDGDRLGMSGEEF